MESVILFKIMYFKLEPMILLKTIKFLLNPMIPLINVTANNSIESY